MISRKLMLAYTGTKHCTEHNLILADIVVMMSMLYICIVTFTRTLIPYQIAPLSISK